MGYVLINDTTLRDGKQSPGMVFQAGEKTAIAKALYATGIEATETGTPTMGEEECACTRQVYRQLPGVTLTTWCRMQVGEARQSADLDMDWVDISIPASNKLWQYRLREGSPLLLERLMAPTHLAHTLSLKVCIGCKDVSRAGDATLQDIARLVREAGTTRLRYADIVGILDPSTTAAQTAVLRCVWPGELEVHIHNDLGLATTNTLVAVRAGATSMNIIVLGLGGCAGNVAPETVALGLECYLEAKTGVRSTALPALCKRAALVARRLIDPQQPLVGELVSTHGSGVHVTALLRDSKSYQAIDLVLPGRGHRLVPGKCSGRQVINDVLDRVGYHLTSAQTDRLLPALRRFVENGKRSPRDNELVAVYHAFCGAGMLQARG